MLLYQAVPMLQPPGAQISQKTDFLTDTQSERKQQVSQKAPAKRYMTMKNDTARLPHNRTGDNGERDLPREVGKRKGIRSLLRRVSQATFASSKKTQHQSGSSKSFQTTQESVSQSSDHADTKAKPPTRSQPKHYKPYEIPRSRKPPHVRIISVKLPSGSPHIARPISYRSGAVSRAKSQHRAQRKKAKSRLFVLNESVSFGSTGQERALRLTDESHIHPAFRSRKPRMESPKTTKSILSKDLPPLPSNEQPMVSLKDLLEKARQEWRETTFDDAGTAQDGKGADEETMNVVFPDSSRIEMPEISGEHAGSHNVWLDRGVCDSPVPTERLSEVMVPLPLDIVRDRPLRSSPPQVTEKKSTPPKRPSRESDLDPSNWNSLALDKPPFCQWYPNPDKSPNIGTENKDGSSRSSSCYSQDSGHEKVYIEPLHPLPKDTIPCPLCRTALKTGDDARNIAPILKLDHLQLWEFRGLRKVCCKKHFPTHASEVVINEAEKWFNVTQGRLCVPSDVQELRISELLKKYEFWNDSIKKFINFVGENISAENQDSAK